MLGHNGWGEIWYLKDIYPKTPLIGYFEFFYRPEGADIEFEPGVSEQLDTAPSAPYQEHRQSPGARSRRSRAMSDALAAVPLPRALPFYAPGRPRRNRHPQSLSPIHRPKLSLPDSNRELTAQDEVVTYVARNLEPYRGFQSFMRSLPAILTRCPNAHVIVVGGDEVGYGKRLPEGKTYREEMLKELGDSLDLSRVHFLGRVPYPTYLTVLQVSRAHVYLTYPFVLSWSMLEALSAGCLVIGSKTAPVEEVLRHRENGLLVDFFDTGGIADAVVDALAHPEAYRALRERARRTHR